MLRRRGKIEAALALDVIHPFSSTFYGPRSKPIMDAGLCCCGLFATKGRNVNKMLVGCPSEPRRTVVAAHPLTACREGISIWELDAEKTHVSRTMLYNPVVAVVLVHLILLLRFRQLVCLFVTTDHWIYRHYPAADGFQSCYSDRYRPISLFFLPTFRHRMRGGGGRILFFLL